MRFIKCINVYLIYFSDKYIPKNTKIIEIMTDAKMYINDVNR